MSESQPPMEIVAYSAWGFDVPLEPAQKRRVWMDRLARGFPYHCLPMSLANLSGWFMHAPHGAVVEWNGGDDPSDLRVEVIDAPGEPHAESAVGGGIMTWTIPYVFRTPPGWNMLCRGPANHIKDGIAPLEGLIETDWSYASFSMNWKMTRPGRVTFEAGEPVAMLVPHARGDLEQFTARRAELASNPELDEGYRRWIESRQAFLTAQRNLDPEAISKRFEKDYFRGETTEGDRFSDHQKTRKLARFETPPSDQTRAPDQRSVA